MAYVHELQDGFGPDRVHQDVFDDSAIAGLRAAASAITIGEELPGDDLRREALLDAAFGRKERFAKTCQRLRDGRLPARGLSLVARKGEDFVGTLRMWHVDAGGVPALLLGPLAVDHAQRSLGIGGLLMSQALRRAAALGHEAVILVGDAPFYARFGFSRTPVLNLAMPGPVDEARFLGLELTEGALRHAQGLLKPTGALDLKAHRPKLSRAIRRAA